MSSARFSAAHAAWAALANAAQEPALAAWSEKELLASLAGQPVALAFLAEHASARYLDKKGGVTEMATLMGLNLTAAELRSNIDLTLRNLEIAPTPPPSAFTEPAAHAQVWEALFTEIKGVMNTVSIAGESEARADRGQQPSLTFSPSLRTHRQARGGPPDATRSGAPEAANARAHGWQVPFRCCRVRCQGPTSRPRVGRGVVDARRGRSGRR
jgi:hypothetical protein